MTRAGALLVIASAACAGEEAMGPGVADPIAMADVRAGPGGSQVVYLPAASTSGVWSGPLSAGVPYRVIVEGTISLWRPDHWSNVCAGSTPLPAPAFASRGTSGPVGSDPEWTWAWPGDSPSLCLDGAPIGPPPRPRRVVVFRPRDGAPLQSLPPPQETRMTPNHAYTYGLLGGGTPVLFAVDDAPIEDNYGVFRIQIAPQ